MEPRGVAPLIHPCQRCMILISSGPQNATLSAARCHDYRLFRSSRWVLSNVKAV